MDSRDESGGQGSDSEYINFLQPPASAFTTWQCQPASLTEVLENCSGLLDPGLSTSCQDTSKVPLIAFLGLMHLRIALLLFVLGRAGYLNDGGIDQGAAEVIPTPASASQRLMVLNSGGAS